MSYTIIKTDGTILTTIPDGIVNTTSTPLYLPGRNYPGYGQVIDTNIVHLLENFADNTPPDNPLRGQLWYNTTDSTLYVCPTDGESNVSNWSALLVAANLGTLNVQDVVASNVLVGNNASLSNTVTANLVDNDYLTVNIQANIANANITGLTEVSNLLTNNISTGFIANSGNITGCWTLAGSGVANSVPGTALWVTSGNLVSDGIKTDNYMWANGAAFIPTPPSGDDGYIQFKYSNVFSSSSNFVFNPDTNLLTVSGNIDATYVNAIAYFTGDAYGISNVQAANINGIVANANYSASAGQATTATRAGTVTTNAQPNITSVGTLTSLAVSGAITAATLQGSHFGSAGGLTNIPGSNVTGVVANATYATLAGSANTATSATIAGSVTNSSQPNITTVGTLAGLTVDGTLIAGTLSGNGAGLSSITGANVTGSVPSANIAGTVTNSSQPFITSLGTLTSVNVSGTATAALFSGSGANLTNLPAGNIAGNVAVANYAINAGNSSAANVANTAGTVTTNAQPNITSVGTLSSLTVASNVTAARLIGDGGYLSNINAANIVGNLVGNISNANYAAYAGNVVNSSQPNITSVGTLTSLTVLGNVTASSFIGSGAGLTNIPVGNIVGYPAYATSTDTANTVIKNAQPNITSVGTLTSLTVSGALSAAGISATGNTNFSSGTQRSRDIIERVTVGSVPTVIGGTLNVDLLGPAITYYTSPATSTWAFNIRGNSTVTTNSYLNVSESVTTTVIVTNGSTGYYPTGFNIDGVSVTPKWLGGSAPTSGTANGTDVYTFAIVKTGSSSYTVFASATKYA